MIILSAEALERCREHETLEHLVLSVWEGDVYNGLSHTCLGAEKVEGIVRVHQDTPQALPEQADSEVVRVEVVKLRGDEKRKAGRQSYSSGGQDYVVKGYVRRGQSWVEHEVQIVPVREDLFSRARGLLETGVLAMMTVLIKGLGSVGSTVARLLVQSGICRFILLDDDRLTVANLIQHEAGLSHIGRHKTRVMADLIHEKNPYAQVHTYEQKLGPDNSDLVRGLVSEATLCIDTADEREGRAILNRLCLEENKPLILGGAFGRAYGGQVLRVRPGKTACYQCLVKLLKRDGNPYPRPESELAAYEDPQSSRRAPIEPGLSIDIEPISHLVAKVALQELLKGVQTTLQSLDRDLEANWYLWLNRREAGTQYENLEPLGFGMGGMRILRWYGIDFPRDPECPVCGNYVKAFAKRAGITYSAEDVTKFLNDHGPKEANHGG